MAGHNFRSLHFSFKKRTAPSNGILQSSFLNDTSAEVATDLTNIASEWNNKLVPLAAGIPDGSVDTSVDAFVKGLDGKNLWGDRNATATSIDQRFYNSNKTRPYTIYELFTNTWTLIDTSIAAATLTSSSGGSSVVVATTAIEGEPFVAGYREITPAGSATPTNITWYTDSGKAIKIWSIDITYDGSGLVTTTMTKSYTAGVLTQTVTDVITYYGTTAIEQSRTRSVS